MAKFIGETGLVYLWAKIKAWVSSYASITDSSGTKSLTVGNTTVTLPTKTSQLTNDSNFATTSDLAGKADKVTGGTSGNLVALDSNGNITDAGVNASSVGTDTKNTAGSTNDAAKLFIVGAKLQAANPQTYSQTNAYITAGKVYSNAKEVVNLSDTQTLTNKTLTSPTLDGTPTATTATAGTNTTQIATTAFVQTAVSGATSDITGQKGQANGIASLDSSGKVPSSQLPSYVDDVIEAYIRSGQTALSQNWLATGSATGTVITPEAGKIYVLMNSDSTYAANTEFRWGGTTYVQLNDSGCTEMTTAEMDTATNNWT